MNVDIETISLTDVEQHSDHYNSAGHTVSEHPAHTEESKLVFDQDATTYDKWFSLICKERQITEHIVVGIDSYIVTMLRDACRLYKVKGKIDQASLDLLMNASAFVEVKDRMKERAWFCRAADVSPKDSPHACRPLRSIDDLVKALMTSWRLYGAYRRHEMKGEKVPVFQIFLIPWDEQCDARYEFRCFVAPVSDIKEARVTAISQYLWWDPLTLDLKTKLHDIALQAQDILKKIKQEPFADGLKQGFTFDIQWRNDRCELMELNNFGALRMTGACLFNWVTDRHILYNEEDDDEENKIVFRVVT